MLTRILHNSDQLHSFFNELGLDLSLPQRQHMLNMADALLVCESTKTLAALQRQFVQAPDASNMADFLRIGPWQAPDVRNALREHQIGRLLATAKRTNAPQVIYINIDDSLGEKDKATRHIQVVDWHYDHSESSKSKLRYKNGFCYLVCTMRVGKHAQELRHKWYTKVCVTTTDGDKSIYFVRRRDGRLADVPHDVRVFFSKRHPRAKALSYFLSTDLSCSTKAVLQGYSWRWSCEVVNFYTKTQLGLADFRVRSYEAVDKYMVVVYLAWAYVEQRFDRECSSQIQTYGDIIRRHRDEHAIDWLTGAVAMAIETEDVNLVLQYFLRLEATSA